MPRIVKQGFKVSQTEWERIFQKSEADRQREFKQGVQQSKQKPLPSLRSAKGVQRVNKKGLNVALGRYGIDSAGKEREYLKRKNGETGENWQCTG